MIHDVKHRILFYLYDKPSEEFTRLNNFLVEDLKFDANNFQDAYIVYTLLEELAKKRYIEYNLLLIPSDLYNHLLTEPFGRPQSIPSFEPGTISRYYVDAKLLLDGSMYAMAIKRMDDQNRHEAEQHKRELREGKILHQQHLMSVATLGLAVATLVVTVVTAIKQVDDKTDYELRQFNTRYEKDIVPILKRIEQVESDRNILFKRIADSVSTK